MSDVNVTTLSEGLTKHRKVSLGTYPTPLDRLVRLSGQLGGPPLYIKREDQSGLAFGGNKTRMLEYVIGQAVEQGADVFIAGGGVAQSNHARMCAAAAIKAGLKPVLVLNQGPADQQAMQGNLLLDDLFGAEVWLVPDEQARQDVNPRFGLHHVMLEVAEKYRAKGNTPYVLPTSSIGLAALGFVSCAVELAAQLEGAGIKQADIYLTSSGSTQAGLLLGADVLGADWRITGLAPSEKGDPQANVSRLYNEAAELLQLANRIEPAQVLNEDVSQGGYALLSDQAADAIRLLAGTEAILLDPVYSGKGFARVVEIMKQRLYRGGTDAVVFVHTGGAPALFAYADGLSGGKAWLDAARDRGGNR